MKIPTTKFVFPLLALALSSAGILTAGDQLKFHSDFDSAMKASQATGKPIVTVFSASWCPPCRMMKKEVYPSTTVAPFHDSFIWAYLDADVPKNRKIMTQHGVQGIPHISFVSSSGKKLHQTVGAMDSSAFAKVLTDVLKKDKVAKFNRSVSPYQTVKGSGSKKKKKKDEEKNNLAGIF